MAENSRKNEFFERESIAMIAITTSNSISVNAGLTAIQHLSGILMIILHSSIQRQNRNGSLLQ